MLVLAVRLLPLLTPHILLLLVIIRLILKIQLEAKQKSAKGRRENHIPNTHWIIYDSYN
jgi:hypothetical protein